MVSFETNIEPTSDSVNLDSVGEGFVDDEFLSDLHTINVEADGYLESISDYANAEAISESLSTLFGEGIGEAYDTYFREVDESFDERQIAKRTAVWEDTPEYTKSEVSELIEKANETIEAKTTEQVESQQALAELKEQLAEIRAELNETRAAAAAQETSTEALDTAAVSADAVSDVNTNVFEYDVRSGDSLSKIAREVYGDASAWPTIYEANMDVIGDNPNMIRPGQTLDIPPMPAGSPQVVYIPTPPDTPVSPPGDTDVPPEQLEANMERVAELESRIQELTKDPMNITQRNVTNDPALDGQRITLEDQLNELDRDYLRNEITPETVGEYETRYEHLLNQYHQVSAGLYQNHVAAIPLQYSDKNVLDSLLDNNTDIARSMERGDVGEINRTLDNAWRDYDDAKMGEGTNHRMAGGYIPNPEEGQAISAAADSHDNSDDNASGVSPAGDAGREGGDKSGGDIGRSGGGKSGGGSSPGGGDKSGGGSSPGSGGPSGGGGLNPIG